MEGKKKYIMCQEKKSKEEERLGSYGSLCGHPPGGRIDINESKALHLFESESSIRKYVYNRTFYAHMYHIVKH